MSQSICQTYCKATESVTNIEDDIINLDNGEEEEDADLKGN